MSEIRDFIGRAVDRMRLNREVFSDKQVPDSLSKVRIVPFFGDVKSEFVLATLLLHRLFPKDYLIVCSWPGHWGIYPHINEYWSPKDENALGDLVRHSCGFDNKSLNVYERLLLRYFENVSLPHEFVLPYYSDGFSTKYFDELKDIEYVLPSIPSAKINFEGDRNKPKIFLSPTKYAYRWGQGREEKGLLEDRFWYDLTKSVIKNGYSPVVLQNYDTYDLSPKLAGQCFFTTEQNLLTILGVMRACDCVLDVFNGLSRYALMARCPYLVCDERQRYFGTHDYVLDDMCGKRIPRSFVFSFAPLASGTSSLIIDALLNKLNEFVPILDRNTWPSTIQQTVYLSYDDVRKRRSQKVGMKFITVPKTTEY